MNQRYTGSTSHPSALPNTPSPRIKPAALNPRTIVDETLQLRLEIVKHVIQVKQAENEAARDLADRRQKKRGCSNWSRISRIRS